MDVLAGSKGNAASKYIPKLIVKKTGFCEVCNDDLTGTAIRAKLNFGCKKCGKEYDEPGAGFEIDHKMEYAEHLLTFGKCEDCGEELETVCKQSGTCPHEPDF